MVDMQVRSCAFQRPHPSHRFIMGRVQYQCPGWAEEAEETEEKRDAWHEGFFHAAEILGEFLEGLPEDHHERPGVIRAIEVLRYA